METPDIDISDLQYAVHAGEPLLARVYRPRSPGPWPALLEVHGGAWIYRDRFHSAVLASELARRGVMVVSIDFRMPPVYRYPASIVDIGSAVRWLKAHAVSLGADPFRLGGLGLSSGGHQVLLSAMRPSDPRYIADGEADAGNDASLRFLVLFYPIVDPLARFTMAREKQLDQLLAGHHAYWADENEMAEGNPQMILDRSELASLPDILIFQGTADTNVPDGMAAKFSAAYHRAGGTLEMREYEGEPHGFILDRRSAAFTDAVSRTVDFALRR
ncbi:MAG: alpha/beta hydrolase [Trebonia sp.]